LAGRGFQDDLAPRKGFLSSRREEVIEDLYNQVKTLETKYRKLYEGSPDMYRTINIDGYIVDCNQAYVENLGFVTKADVIGHSVFEHAADQSMEAMRQSFKEWQLVGHVRNKEVSLKRRDGTIFPALINATSLYDNDGHLVGSNTVIVDMTEMLASRQRLQEANDALKKAQEIREDFIRVAAHDLRNPIQPILMAAELAKRSGAHRDQALDIIVKEASRLKQLANDLLDVSKIESGVLLYEKKHMSASELVAEIMEEAKLLVGERANADSWNAGLSITCQAHHGDDLEIEVDKSKIIQAMLNIISNSIKFTKQGQISISSRANEEAQLEIRVADSGPGIPQELLPKLFEKFATKNPDGNFSAERGTGLGLFICKSIIAAHGGSVSATNNGAVRGATFTVRLPARNSGEKN
jgi:PAS domain S-box-containing protein